MATRRFFKELRLQQFRALLEVARKGSFTAAASSLGLSRTSIYQQIKGLEDDFGVELTIVRGQQMSLTPDGKELVAMIEPVVESFDEVKSAFLDRHGRLDRSLIVASTISLIQYDLRAAIESYRASHPEVSLSLVDRTSLASLELLLHGKADVAIVGRVSEFGDERNLKIRPLMHYPFVLACPKNHELVSRTKFKLDELKRHPLILPSVGTNARTRIDEVFAKSGLAGKVHLALDSTSANFQLGYVEQGMGIALVSLSPVLKSTYSGRIDFRDVSEIFGREDVLLVQRRQRFPLKHVSDFVDAVNANIPQSK
jgi:LysR family transcriptional activator of glutamate synthase operon